ncbi:MAG: FAD-dependent oxidoreductase [Anaerolineales bacterium]|nr:FAD-dependent oxidoreductase [Anaerolineales bacterium]
MTGIPDRAQVAIVGAGIVGNSLAYHLADLGWKDVVLLDKGPLPNPGGSTGHASNFIFPVDHSKEMTALTVESIKTFSDLGVFTGPGGIEIARTEERMQELTRRLTSAKAWGVPGELITPEQVKEKVPFINAGLVKGGFWSPTAGVVDPLQAGTLMREHAQKVGSLRSVHANVEITDIDVQAGRVCGLDTDHGYMSVEYVVIACGVWSPRLAAMAGAEIPLTPMVHQFVTVGPIAIFESTRGEIDFPLVRDMDVNMYERQNGSDLEIGSYSHRPIHHAPGDIPSNEEASLTPTELPFTDDDFDESMENALELMPEILENVGTRHAINGLMSLTSDGGPIIGETPEVKGLWSVAAIWIKEAPAFGRVAAEWMTRGYSEIDAHSANIARFFDHSRTLTHVRARTSESFNKMYGIVHPSEQYESVRNARISPFFARQQEQGVVYFETAGWERPQWYQSNEKLIDSYGDRVMPRSAEWDSRWWSPVINAEHLAMRDRVGLFDLTAFSIFEFSGVGVLDYIQRMVVNQMNVPVGRAVYTPLLEPQGGFKADLTIMRIAEDRFRVVTGCATGNIDKKWFCDHMPEDGSVRLEELSSSLCTLGLWGPRARDVLESVSSDDVSHDGLPYGYVKEITIGVVKALAFRISYVGELGWEIYTEMEHGLMMWDTLWEAGRPHGMLPVGMGVYGTTARLEKGYRAYGMELESEYNPVEAGLARPKIKRDDFIGKEAYLLAHGVDPAAILCTLTLDDPTSSSGELRYMLGKEPILAVDGAPIVDSHGRHSYVTSAGSGPSLGKHILLGYLPPDVAQQGTQLKVEYLGEHYPVSVAVAGSTPLFDPTDERMKQ